MLGLKELMKKLEEDIEFAQDLKNATSKELLIEKLKAVGFELSNDDLDEILKLVDELELSDNDLENASGGMREYVSAMY